MTQLAPPAQPSPPNAIAAHEQAAAGADLVAALGLLRSVGQLLRGSEDTHETLSRAVALLVPVWCDLAVLELHDGHAGHSFIVAAEQPELAARARHALEGDGRAALRDGERDSERALREQLGIEELLVARLREHGTLLASTPRAGALAQSARLVVDLVAQQIASYLEAAALRGAVERERDASQAAQLKAESEAMLLGVVSHELRNPLAVMMLAVSLLKERGLTAQQERVVRRLDTAGRQSERLISDLLDFTAARRMGIALARADRDLHAVVGAALDDLRDAWPGRLIEHVRTGDGLSFIDEGRIAQLVMNLVGNALQHSPASSPVRVETHGDDGAMRIRVANEGEPIPAELIPQLFEPLRRGPRAGKRTGSLGLGLFIVHHLVRAHGGSIEVTSTAEVGTRFDIHLPRAERGALHA